MFSENIHWFVGSNTDCNENSFRTLRDTQENLTWKWIIIIKKNLKIDSAVKNVWIALR